MDFLRTIIRYYRFLMMIVLVGSLLFVTYVLRVRYGIEVVFTHLFYLPTILASFWWRKLGIIVAVILSAFLILSDLFLKPVGSPIDDVLRVTILLTVSFVSAFASSHIAAMKKAVELSNKELNQIFNKSSNGMLVVDRNYKILQMNRAFMNLMGLSWAGDDDFLNVHKKCYEVSENPYCGSSYCPCKNVFDGAPFFERDMMLKERNGNDIYCIVAASPFRTDDRGVSSVILDFKNITERKENEKKHAQHRKQLRTMASELSLAEERERRRLATNLHDSVSQLLFVSKMKLSALIKEKSGGQEDDVLKDIYDNIERALSETRTLIFEISPPILYELGLEGAIEWLCEKIEEKHNLPCSFESDMCGKPIDLDVNVLLFQTIRELLNNVVKHAKATRIRISLKAGDEYVRCVVEDDGVGFDTAMLAKAVDGNGGFGLFNIRERLNYFEGNLLLESRYGQGTKATIITPYKSYVKKLHGGDSI